MSSNWPPEAGTGPNAGGYGADDFGVDPDYPSDGGHYGNSADQGSYDWQGAAQSYPDPGNPDRDAPGYGIAAYEGDSRNQVPYSQGSYDQDPYRGPSYGGTYSQNGYGPNAYSQDPHGQDGYGAAPYGSPPASASSYAPAADPSSYYPGADNQGVDNPGSGSSGSYGQHTYGQAPPVQDPYAQGSYAQGSYGQAAYEQDDPYGRTGNAAGAYYQAPYSDAAQGDSAAYGDTPASHGGYPRSGYLELTSGQQGDYALDGSSQDAAPGNGYGPSYAGEDYGGNGSGHGQSLGDQPGNGDASAYGQDDRRYSRYSNGDYGSTSPGSGTRDQPASGQTGDRPPGYTEHDGGQDSYGRDLYAQEGYGAATARRGWAPPGATSAYQQPSTGSFAGQDTGSFTGQDTGSFAGQDTGSYDSPHTGSFSFDDSSSFTRPRAGTDDEPDSSAFPRPDTGSFGRPEPGAFARSGSVAGGGRASGYEPWGDADDGDGWEGDESDGDWHDEGDSSLLSRRFGDEEDDDPGDGGRRGSRRRTKKTKRPRRLRGRVAVLASVLAAALIVGAIGEYGYHEYSVFRTSRYGDYTGAGTGKVKFTVPQGAALSALGPALVKAGVIMEVRPFNSAAAAAGTAKTLQPGVYLLHHHMSAADAVSYLLSSAHRLNDTVRIIEGTRASAIAKELAAKTHLPVSQFTELIDHPSQLGLPSWASGAKTAEGFLFPDTYDLLPHESALKILRAMVAEFNQQVTSIDLVSAAKKVNTDAWHTLIVASMVQQEAGSPSNFGPIARVVWNRLGKSMPLEFDSTVFYAMGIYGTAITAKQEKFNSPYNTYEHTGLPPGPIGNPGIAAIQATLHPPHGNWLYFITDTRKKPYVTHFTNSLTQLQQWQAEFGN